ncbi:MAG: response regulator [Prochloraceae cyanobacterium]|nr:response regulator [Prochloraceae cyanobacterium]
MVFVEPRRILLVEDDPNDVRLIQLSLSQYNFINQIDIAEDGEQALVYLHGQNGSPPTNPLPRLVLLDLKLPKINGIRVLETIRNHPRTSKLVVVVMTSSAEDRDLEACYEFGVNSYVVKPLNFEEFLEVTRRTGTYWMRINQIPRSLAIE